jgi:hypothetical protein
MYQHIVVEAETFEKACDMVMSDDISRDSEEMDCENARATAAKAMPDGSEVKPAQQLLIIGPDLIGMSLASFLYENPTETGPALEIPNFRDPRTIQLVLRRLARRRRSCTQQNFG